MVGGPMVVEEESGGNRALISLSSFSSLLPSFLLLSMRNEEFIYSFLSVMISK
ncbi:hypothetical protein KFK09_002740 [Dendrobium nobile]|uniref:Uncharacterized protein n=1 Tax=Dendrobium nobile TaxID=94219 RepID=A0A8T3C7Q7_DENNO|nr:hypothetical protein KFK09_002740 [Dendrobium nobile]